MPTEVHLVGEFPLSDPLDCFTLASRHLDGMVTRFPYGRHVASGAADASAVAGDRALLPGREEVTAAWEAFQAARRARILGEGARLQLHVRPAFMRDAAHGGEADVPLDETFGSALADHVRDIVEGLQATELAIQIEVPVAHLAVARCPAASAAAVTRMVLDAVPPGADAVIHFCCLDGPRYRMSPSDMAMMVDIANRTLAGSARPVQVLHVPCPLRHEDDGFFRPLADLQSGAETRLSLGLVHLSDGLSGALQRADYASRHASDFGVAARCGFSARAPEDIPGFLQLHADVARALD